MSTLWDKGYAIDETLAKFTVGSDPVLDKDLTYFDCIASIAHAHMLHATGLLTDDEASALAAELSVIAAMSKSGDFEISTAQEDSHTAIENHLTLKLGDVGKKIHAARSRNDQVMTALRLYSKEQTTHLAILCHALSSSLITFAEQHANLPLVGRTHMQKAMPSSFALWAMSFAESLMDDAQILQDVYTLIDQCPLGSAASYGVNWPIDRELTAQLLGFAKVQNNVLYAANSRGKFEAALLHAMTQVMGDLSKMAADLIFFALPEIAYITIPAAFCSGSSLMPQKLNPCALELARAKAATVASYLVQTLEICRALPSGYNRDLQETKAPLMHGFDTTKQCVAVMTHLIEHLKVNHDACIKAFTPEVYATDHAMRLTSQGVPFRDAYKQVGQNLDSLKLEDPRANIQTKTHIGATGNLRVELSKATLAKLRAWLNHEQSKWNEVSAHLLGKGNK